MVLTRQILENYKSMEREIEMLERKLDYYAHKKIESDHGVVQASMKSFPFAPTHIVVSGANIKSDEEYQRNLRQKLITLAEKKRNFDRIELEIDNAIEEIPDLEMKQIIEMRYLWGFTDAEIGNELKLERSTITKRVAKFFNE